MPMSRSDRVRARRPSSPRRRALSSVRVRLTAIAVAAIGLTFAIGGFALEWQLQRSAIGNVENLAVTEAGDIGALIARGSVPARLTADRPGIDIQVVGPDNRVLSTTADLVGKPPVARARPPASVMVHLTGLEIFRGDDDPDAAVALGVHTPAGLRTILVVSTTEPAEDSVHASILPLAALLVSLLVAAGFAAWFLTGRALRPVERIRGQVATISGGDLHQRVSEPPTDDEVGRLAQTMNAMLSRLQSASDRQAQFVADASHELRSPLAALLAELEVARDHPETADWGSVTNAAITDGVRLQRIIEDLLLLARSDEDHLVPRREQVDLDELALAEGARMLSRGQVRVDLHAVGAARLTGDRELLRRLVRNLADNAEHHASSTVAFEVRRRGELAELVVSDDGPGIPTGKREWVFERFARLDEGRGRRSGGTGLGLAIVGEIVSAHHGSVRVADSSTGTRMRVLLPSAGDEPAGEKDASTAMAVGSESGALVSESIDGEEHAAPLPRSYADEGQWRV